MNGEVQSYNLNSPMKWAQFKQMPDDIKREYLSSIISKYNPQQAALAEMFGISRNTVCNMFRELGIPFRGNVSAVRTGRNDAFWAWVNSATVAEPEQESMPDDIPTAEPAQRPHGGAGAPESGMLVFSDTTAQEAFNVAYTLLAAASMRRMVISWEAAHE